MEEKSYNVIDSVRKYAKEIYSKSKKIVPVVGLVATMYATPVNADLQIESRVAEGYAPIELVKKMDPTVYQGDSVLAGNNESNDPTCRACVFLECITCQCPEKPKKP